MKNKYLKIASTILITILSISHTYSFASNTTNSKDDYLANIKSYTFETKEAMKGTELQLNLTTYTFNHPASTYNFFDENGIFNSVYTSKDNVYWSKFDSNMKITQTVNWPLFYNVNKEENVNSIAKDLTYNFGGALYYNSNLYVMYSRYANYSTTEERDKEKVMAMAKYDKNGKMIKVKEYLGVELNSSYMAGDVSWGTSAPFYTSNCSLAVNDGVIACFFGRNMFSSHQSSMIMFIEPDTLEFVSNLRNKDLSISNFRRYYYPYGHAISHSLGQRIIPTSDGQFLMMESGDAGAYGSTRGLNLTKIYEEYDDEISTNVLKTQTKKMVHYSEGGRGTWGYNNTYSVLGNIIELSDGYMYIGGLDKQLNRSYGNNIDNPWNLFVQKYSKDFYKKDNAEDMQLLKTEVRETSGIPAVPDQYGSRLYLTGNEKDYGMKWLTDLQDECIIGVRAVKTEEENIVILWEQFKIEKWYYQNEYQGYRGVNTDERTMYYMVIDKNANVITKPTEVPDKRLSSDEQYAYKDGKVYWVTAKDYYNELTINVLDIKNPTKKPDYLLGDVDENGKVDAQDAVMILKYVAHNITLTDKQLLAANTTKDKDGTVDAQDAVQILKLVAHNITEF